MSLIVQNMQNIGGIIAATPGTLLRGAQGTVQMACALTGALTNTSIRVVSSVAKGALQMATSAKDTTAHIASAAVNGTLNLAKSAVTGLKNGAVNTTCTVARGGWGLTKSAASGLGRGAIYLLNAGKEAAVAKSVHNYAELFFRIQNLSDKIWNDVSEKVPLSQFNRNDLAQRLEAFLQLQTLQKDDTDFVVGLCADLRDPRVIFDKSKKLQMERLATILPPDFIVPVSQAHRNELAERLEEFIELYSLSADDNASIAGLCRDLRNVSVVFNKDKEAEMEALTKILFPYFEQHQNYILSKISERQNLEKVPFLSTSAPPKMTPEQTLEGIQKQVDFLKSNAIKLVLGSVILNMTLGLYTCDQIDIEAFKKALCKDFEFPPTDGKNTNLVNFLIEITNKAEVEGISSEELFKKLVYRAIDFSGRGLLARIHAKFRCAYTSGLIANLMGNLVDNLKDTLVQFAKLSPAKQLEEITTLFIDPLLQYFKDVENGQPPQAVITASSNKFWLAFFRRNQPGPKTPDELLDHFIEVFLTQFLDKKYQPWTRTARTSYLEKAYSSSYFVKAFYLSLAGFMWIAGKIIAPFQWTLNETIHFVLRTIGVGICPGLATSTKDSLEIGKPHAWYTLKSNYLLMLQQSRLTALLPRTEDPAYQPPRQIPAEVTAKFNTFVDILLRQLGEQNPLPTTSTAPFTQPSAQSSTSHAVFNTFVSSTAAAITESIGEDPAEAKRIRDEASNQLVGVVQQNLNSGDLGWLKDILKTSLTDLTLDMYAQEGFINETLLSYLTSTNASSFIATPVPVANEEKERIDAELNHELGLLGPRILESVNANNRTDKIYQTAANIFIRSLQNEVENFQRALLQAHENPDLLFRKESQTLCVKFLQNMAILRAKLIETVDESTQALLLPYITEAQLRATILSSYVPGDEIEKTRKQVEAKFDELYSLLEMPLDNEEEIFAILCDLRALNPTFIDLNAFEADLNERVEVYQKRLQSPKKQEKYPKPSAYANPLLQLVAQYKDQANLRGKLAEFDAWAKKLKFVKVKVQPTVKDAAMAHLYSLPMVSALASAELQAYGRNFFTFISDEDNLAGIAQRGMEAYLNKPDMILKKEHLFDNLFYRVNRDKSRPLTAAEEAELNARGWVSLNHQ